MIGGSVQLSADEIGALSLEVANLKTELSVDLFSDLREFGLEESDTNIAREEPVQA